MAVNWGLAQPQGFDYLESLQALGNASAQRQRTQVGAYDFQQRQAADAARPAIQQQAASGDFAGAQAQAFTLGDYDALKYVSGLETHKREKVAREADVMGRLATSLRRLPADQRSQAFRTVAPMLQKQGFGAHELAGVSLEDGALDQYIALATDTKTALEQYAKSQQPFDLADGQQRYAPDGTLIAANERDAKWQFDSESGSWLQEPGTGGYVSGGQPAMQPGGGDPASTFSRMIGAESGGRQFAANGQPLTSPKGAVGIAQVMPSTAPEAAKLAGVPWDPNRYRTDPAYNQAIGQAYFEKQLASFGGDEAKAAAAYNAGPGRVRRAIAKGGDNWIDHVPAETQAYVAKVTGGNGGVPNGRVVNVRPARQQRGNVPSGYEPDGSGGLRPIRGGPADPATSTSRNVQSNRKAEADFRKEFDGLPEVKDFKKARTQFMGLREMALNPKATAQDDIAVIFSFMKTLDPTSTVREGEFATAQNAAGVPDTIRNALNKAQNGERLNPKQRANMVRTAYASYKAFRDAYNGAAERYRGYATDNGINADRVARTYTPDKPAAKPDRMSQFKIVKVQK